MINLRELDDGTIQKRCWECHGWLPIPDGFALSRQNADGFQNACRQCSSDMVANRNGSRKAAVRLWLRSG